MGLALHPPLRASALACAIVLLAGACGGTDPAAPADPSVPLSVTTTGDDANPCTQAEPCRTFDRAYRAALPGQAVEVAAGAYELQAIDADPTRRAAKRIVIRPAAGDGTVRVEGIEVRASHLELSGFTLGSVTTFGESEDIVLRDLTIRGGFFILSSRRVSIIGGSVGPGVDFHPMIAAEDESATPPRDIVVDGVLFHDWTRSNESVHTECLQIGGGDGIAIRNSRFRGCDVMDLHVSHWGASPLTKNVTIENNFFSATGDGGFYTIGAYAFENLLIRNNSFAQPFKIFTDGPGPNVNVRVIGNVGPLAPWACEPGVLYRHNVWDGATCGATDVDAPSGFVAVDKGDLHLRAGAAAIDRGDPAARNGTDIDGDPRAAGRPDAGADERT